MSVLAVQRGDIFYADLSPVWGSEQGGVRPVVMIQNNIGNKYSPTVIVAAITSQIDKAKLPTHVEVSANDYGLNSNCVILLEQIRSIDKRRLKEKIGSLTAYDMGKVDKSLSISINLLGGTKTYITEKNENIINQEIKEINEAINILKGIAVKHNIKEYIDKESMEEKYITLYEDTTKDIKSMFNEFNEISEDMKDMHIKIKPLVEKQKIAKGKLTEFAVVDYFKNEGYFAEKVNRKLDALKIDVVAKDKSNKIFSQVKSGQIGSQEIVKFVNSVVELEGEYDEENLKRVACVCADEFPPYSDILRIRLEEEFKIRIMFIHKYQVLKICSEYKSTVN